VLRPAYARTPGRPESKLEGLLEPAASHETLGLAGECGGGHAQIGNPVVAATIMARHSRRPQGGLALPRARSREIEPFRPRENA